MAARKKSAATTGSGPKKSAPRSARKIVPVAERRNFDDWKRVPGSAKRYRNTRTGEELSNRQYRERFLYGSRSLEKVARERGAPRTNYSRLLKARQEYLSANGIKANLQDIRRSDAMKSIVRDIKKHRMHQLTAYERRQLKKNNPKAYERYVKMYGPDSDLARALADLGYRDHDARHFVGDS